MSKLQEIEKVLGRELPNGDRDMESISDAWHAFFENPTKYAGTQVVAMINQFVDENIRQQVELSKGYSVVMTYTRKERTSNLYDILLYKENREVCKLSGGCIGEKSANTWMEYGIRIMKRILYLVTRIDIAHDVIFTCSRTHIMDEPKDRCEDIWSEKREEAKMLETWLVEIFNGMGEDRRTALMNEFSEYVTVHD